MENIINGIYIGKDSALAVIDDFYIAFLRLREDLIVSVFRHSSGFLAVVYGHGKNFDAYSQFGFYESVSDDCIAVEGFEDLVRVHTGDTVRNTAGCKAVYTTYNGKDFENVLAEKIDMSDFKSEFQKEDTVAACMASWVREFFYGRNDSSMWAGIDTTRYSATFNIRFSDGRVYCRLGQNGFCERGRAMLSTICIRSNECRMVPNNLVALRDYRPDGECFVEGTCAFPYDSGWYWSVSSVTEDEITLNGCDGDVYRIRRSHQ